MELRVYNKSHKKGITFQFFWFVLILFILLCKPVHGSNMAELHARYLAAILQALKKQQLKKFSFINTASSVQLKPILFLNMILMLKPTITFQQGDYFSCSQTFCYIHSDCIQIMASDQGKLVNGIIISQVTTYPCPDVYSRPST